jgi:chromosome segregation ATPase
VLKIYSIKEIIDASNQLLVESQEVNEELNIDSSIDKKEKSIPKEIESIIAEAENSQRQNIKHNPAVESNQKKKNSFEELKVSKDELVESMHKTFSKKIKKNTLKLIIELREEIILLTKKISSLEKQKKQEQLDSEILEKNIIDLTHIKNVIKNDLQNSLTDFNTLKEQHKNLDIEHDLLKEQHKNLNIEHGLSKNQHQILKVENVSLKKNLLNLRKILIQLKNQTIYFKNNNIKIHSELNDYKNKELTLKSKIKKIEEKSLINRSLEINNHELKGTISRYIKKNNELQNEIDELKDNSTEVTNNDNYSDDMKELQNKVKHYQDENIRISNEFVESNKKYEITRESLNELQKHRGDLMEKIKSINEVIQNENIVTSVFNTGLEKDKTKKIDEQKPIKIDASDLDDKIKNIFGKS